MKTLRKIMHLTPLLLFWLMITVFFWSWIFTFLTDAPRKEKIVLFVECDVPENTYIASRLEEFPSDVIRLAQVKPFSYSMMSSDAIRESDLYIVSESGFHEYFEWFAPLPENAQAPGEVFVFNGIPYGFKAYDKETASGILTKSIDYPAENHYLVFGKSSLHLMGNENAVSDEAVNFARYLFEIE
ncbi:MAG: hypothetical protein IKJ65_08470 [Clostridia bacterium]|nr:hypothetical protein [Clostridia bacterium]